MLYPKQPKKRKERHMMYPDSGMGPDRPLFFLALLVIFVVLAMVLS